MAPRRRTSLATKLLNIILRMDDFPEPDLPISRTFFLAGFALVGAELVSIAVKARPLVESIRMDVGQEVTIG